MSYRFQVLNVFTLTLDLVSAHTLISPYFPSQIPNQLSVD